MPEMFYPASSCTGGLNLDKPEPNRTRINADERGSKTKNLTDAILCCFYTVYNILGY